MSADTAAVATTADAIKGVAVSSTGPSTNDILTYNGSAWAPNTVAGALGFTPVNKAGDTSIGSLALGATKSFGLGTYTDAQEATLTATLVAGDKAISQQPIAFRQHVDFFGPRDADLGTAVTDSTGAPVSGALVFLRPDNSSGGPPISPLPILSGVAAGGQYFATTDSSGNYTINNVPTGSYTATGSAQGENGTSSPIIRSSASRRMTKASIAPR